MKAISVFVCAVVLSVILLPHYALAQGSDPPDCCGKGSKYVMPPGAPMPVPSVDHILISDASLQAMGISRSDFVDRLSASLLFGKNIDLIISVSRSVGADAANALSEREENQAEMEGILLGVQEKRTYRVPRARLQASDVDALDEFSITDGTVVIGITFKNVDAARIIN